MANIVYIGNYPTSLTDEDILDIFEDFEGVVLLRSIRKDKKCYSFILCQNQDQVVEVVLTLNDIDIGGRNLVVRASDDNLQELIERSDLEVKDFREETSEQESDPSNDCSSFTSNGSTFSDQVCVLQERNVNNHCNSFTENDSINSDHVRVYRQPRNPSRFVPVSELSKMTINESHLSKSVSQSSIGSHSSYKDNFSSSEINKSEMCVSEKEKSCKEYKCLLDQKGSYENLNYSNLEFSEDKSNAFLCSSDRNGSSSPCSTTSSQFTNKDKRGEKFSLVSVVNFRNGTTLDELEELFSDYSPFKIIIKVHKSYDGLPPTEAVVCFLKSKNAFDSIINLDNTLFKGRVLLVTECEDPSISGLLEVTN